MTPYRFEMAIVMAVLVAQMLLPDADRIWFNWIGYTNFDELTRLAAIAAFLFQPTFMDIPATIYRLHGDLPGADLALCLQDKWAPVLVVSLLARMACQLGLHRLVTHGLNSWIIGGDGQGIRASFNMLGWQAMFFSALVLGVLTANKTIDWSKVFAPEKTLVPKAALAICLFFLPLRLATAHDLLPGFVIGEFATMEVRGDFGPVYLPNFAAAAMGLPG